MQAVLSSSPIINAPVGVKPGGIKPVGARKSTGALVSASVATSTIAAKKIGEAVRERVVALTSSTTREPLPQTIPAMLPPLWMMIVLQLDPQAWEYHVNDLAPLLHLKTHSLRNYCRELWPDWEDTRYYLSFEQACYLIARACRNARNIEPRALYFALVEQGVITGRFPDDLPVLVRAGEAIKAERTRRSSLRAELHHHDV